MRRLGYTRYVAQGGDWGAQITDVIGAKAPPELLGIHSNMPGTVPPEISKALTSNVFGTGDPAPTGLSRRRAARLRPAQLPVHQGRRLRDRDGLAPADAVRAGRFARRPSPPGCSTTTRTASRTSPGRSPAHPVGNLTRDEVLDNITMTWLTNTGVSSGRLYWENTLGFFDIKGVNVPAAVTRLPARAVPGAAELDREGLPQPDLLQRARQGQPLRGLAGAGAIRRGAARGVPLAPFRDDATRRAAGSRR